MVWHVHFSSGSLVVIIVRSKDFSCEYKTVIVVISEERRKIIAHVDQATRRNGGYISFARFQTSPLKLTHRNALTPAETYNVATTMSSTARTPIDTQKAPSS